MNSDRDLLLVSVFTFLTVFLWVFFELVKTAKTTTIETNVQKIITPFAGAIDTDILKTLENRKIY